MALKDKSVFVTGGTKGLGKAIAIEFARCGARVAVNYHADENNAAETEGELKAISKNVICLRGDVSKQSAVDRMIHSILERWDRIDILVNNAGIIRDRLLMFLTETDWDDVIATNLKGTYLCSRAVLKTMIAQKSGRIINMTSPSALTGRAGQTNYSASKGGIISFTKSLSREVARIGITVNAVCPGVIATSMTESLKPDEKKMLTEMIPMGRFGTPEDVVGAVLFLSSDQAGYITGHVLTVDGGMT
jgi:3-oxoacyl-[acyl-carrier protein] reductase